MTHAEILEIVRAIVAEQHDEPLDAILSSTHFFDDLTDSLDFQEIVLSCEERFEILIPDNDAASLVTVSLLTDYIFSLQEGWPPAPTLLQE